MRKFLVWVNDHEEILEFPHDCPYDKIKEECEAYLEEMLTHHVDSGWIEVTK